MGACCVSRENKKNRELDLPPPSVEGNAFQKFELSLPFGCTWVDTFEKRVREHAEGGAVTLENLRTTCTTPAWKEINDDDSKLCQLLKHEVFAKGEGLIDVDSLLCFSLFHCVGSGQDKAQVLYGLL